MKKILILLMLLAMMLVLCGCDKAGNPDILSTKASNTKAYIKVNGHTVTVDMDRYLIGSNGTISVYATNGIIYKTHIVNVVLVTNEDDTEE